MADEPQSDSPSEISGRAVSPRHRTERRPVYNRPGLDLLLFAVMVGAIVFVAVFGLFALAAWIGG